MNRWTIAHQAQLSMEFSREEYWSRLSFPSPGDLPDPGLNLPVLLLLHWQVGPLPAEPPGKPMYPASVQFSPFALSCPTLCNPMNGSTLGLPVHHQLPEFTQTHVHQVSDAIQPSHPLLSPSPPAPNPSQYQGLF